MQVSCTRNLHQKFDASFSCEFLVRVSCTSFLCVCHQHYTHFTQCYGRKTTPLPTITFLVFTPAPNYTQPQGSVNTPPKFVTKTNVRVPRISTTHKHISNWNSQSNTVSTTLPSTLSKPDRTSRTTTSLSVTPDITIFVWLMLTHSLFRLGDGRFLVAGPKVWNSLPVTLRQPDDEFRQFKRLLKTAH